jgi:hypothetical protein
MINKICFLIFIKIKIWIKGPQLTDRDSLNNKISTGYYHPTKTLEFKIGRLHWSDSEDINQSNARIPHF